MSDAAPPSHEDFAAMGAPTAEHQKLQPFVGTFAATVKIWFGPGEPSVTTGTMTNSMELGGRYLRQVYEGKTDEGPFPDFQGRGYWGYNTTDKRWEGFWIDSASTMMTVEHGQLDSTGKVWTMTSECTNPSTGQPMARRSVITLSGDDHHTMEMYVSTPQGEMKSMEIEYQRK